MDGKQVEALKVYNTREYQGFITPMINEKIGMVVREICAHDENDERNRGILAGLRWLSLRMETIQKEVNKNKDD